MFKKAAVAPNVAPTSAHFIESEPASSRISSVAAVYDRRRFHELRFASTLTFLLLN
jgi:hypothetical protein